MLIKKQKITIRKASFLYNAQTTCTILFRFIWLRMHKLNLEYYTGGPVAQINQFPLKSILSWLLGDLEHFHLIRQMREKRIIQKGVKQCTKFIKRAEVFRNYILKWNLFFSVIEIIHTLLTNHQLRTIDKESVPGRQLIKKFPSIRKKQRVYMLCLTILV